MTAPPVHERKKETDRQVLVGKVPSTTGTSLGVILTPSLIYLLPITIKKIEVS